MPAKKKKVVRRARTRRAAVARRTATRLQRTLKSTQAALSSAESNVQKRVRGLIKRTGVDTRKAAATLKEWNSRFERERKKAVRRLEARISQLQERAKKERRAITRRVDETVQSALAALNIPSRHEVHELTRKVDELSRRIDRFRR
jgi:polyhydroxyalkanoate synthesis regulator phasin